MRTFFHNFNFHEVVGRFLRLGGLFSSSERGLADRLVRALYTKNWTPFVVATLFPFPLAAIVAAGSVVIKIPIFICVVFLFILSWLMYETWPQVENCRSLSMMNLCRVHSRFLSAVLLFAIVIYLLYSLGFTPLSFLFSALSVSSLLLLLDLSYDKAWQVILGTIVLHLAMSCLSVLGVLTQIQDSAVYSVACLGLVPAVLGACSLIVRFTTVLERDAWTRRRYVINKKGENQLRPGFASIIFCFYVLFVLGAVFWMSVLAYLPFAFILSVLPLMYMSNCLTRYFESEEEDPQLLPLLQFMYFVTSLCMVFVGAMARAF